MRLLLVDDDPAILLLAATVLRLGGLEVEEAAGPQAALAAPGRWDALVVDVQMPGMSGPELVGSLRQRPGCEKVPVIFLTGDRTDPAIAAIRPAGVVDKPFDPLTLADRIRELLVGYQAPC